MPEMKVVKQGIEPMEKVCPVLVAQGSKQCLGPQCAWFRGDVVTGLCAVPDIAGWLGNAYHAEYPAKG